MVWFYLTWIDPRVKGQIAENAAKLANETLNYKCDSPCQSNNKPVAGGCCDGEEGGMNEGLYGWAGNIHPQPLNLKPP